MQYGNTILALVQGWIMTSGAAEGQFTRANEN